MSPFCQQLLALIAGVCVGFVCTAIHAHILLRYESNRYSTTPTLFWLMVTIPVTFFVSTLLAVFAVNYFIGIEGW